MVGKREGKVGVEHAAEALSREVNDLGRDEQGILRERLHHGKQRGVYLVEALLDARVIVPDLIGDGMKADALSKDHGLPAGRIDRKGNVVVDAPDYPHK